MDRDTTRRAFLGAVAGASLGLASRTAHPAPASRRDDAKRNIVFILTDDQRFDAVGGFGNAYFRTPELDRLARNGLWFENAFVTTSLCSPSRASILTGQYAHRHRVLDNRTPLSPDIPTFPRELQQAGYLPGPLANKGHIVL